MRGEFIQEYHAGTISSDTKSCNTIWSRNSERYQLRLLLMVFFFNQRVISASNDAPKTISRDRMIAGRSHLSIDRGSEIKIKGTVQRGRETGRQSLASKGDSLQQQQRGTPYTALLFPPIFPKQTARHFNCFVSCSSGAAGGHLFNGGEAIR